MEVLTIKRGTQTNRPDFLKVLLILSIPYLAVMLSHNGFLAMLPFVREEFALTRTQVGYFTTFFFLSAAMLAVFTGSVVDKVGPKKGIMLGVGSLGVMNLLFGLSPTYTILLILALVAGLGFSIVTPAVNKGVMIETPPAKRAVSMGIMQSGSGIGGLLGASLLPMLGEVFGWRITVQFAGVFALLMALFVYNLYRESTGIDHLEDYPESQEEKNLSLKDNLRFFLTKKYFLFACLFGAIIAGSSMGAILSHFAVFISEDLHFSRAAAGLGLGVFHVGAMIGRPSWGWFSDRFLKGDRRKTLLLIGLAAGIMFLLPALIFTSPHPSAVFLYVFSFFLGFSALGWAGVFFVAIGEFAGEARTGAATGLALLSVRAGILIAPPIFGLIADARGYDYSWLLFGAILILISFFYYLGTSSRGPGASSTDTGREKRWKKN